MESDDNFMNWDNPGNAVITGASSGIGASFAKALAAQGFGVTLIARRKTQLEELSSELTEKNPIKTDIIVADLSKQSDIEQVAEKISKIENIEVLINCAGFGTQGYFDLIEFESQINMMFVHNIAPVYFCRAVLPIMIKRGRGAIVNVSSLSAFVFTPQNVMYSSTKAFLNAFTENLDLELLDTGVKVQALCPGFTHTGFHDHPGLENVESRVPENMWMDSEDVVKLSLDAFRENKVIFIPGAHNQNYVDTWNHPKYGKRVREKIIKAFHLSRE